MDRTLLQATDLTVRYGEKLALDHVNLEIAAGETLALVGLPAVVNPHWRAHF